MTTSGLLERPDRLLTPPRVPVFCPGEHCARVCDTESCTCLPCRCPRCLARARKAATGRLRGRQVVESMGAHPRLFPSPSSRSQV